MKSRGDLRWWADAQLRRVAGKGRAIARDLRPGHAPEETEPVAPLITPEVRNRPPYADLLLRPIQPGRIRTRYEVRADVLDFDTVQRLYLDFEGRRLVPNVQVWHLGQCLLNVNRHGCKGEDIEPDAPVIAFFGDSSTMGVLGWSGQGFSSWPAYVDVPGYAVLNAAIEGSELARMAEQYERLRDEVQLACVVVHGSWHNLIYNRTDEAYWDQQLSRFLGKHETVICTLATSMTPEFATRGMRELVNVGPDASADSDYFGFFGPYEPEDQLVPLLNGLDRYNRFLAKFAAEHRVHLVDLHAYLQPANYAEATTDFFDVAHMRPSAYPRVGKFISGELHKILPPDPPRVRSKLPGTPAAATEDLRANIYPVW